MNPFFWFVLFALGYVFGLLLKNPTGFKFLLFGFVGIAIYQPVRDAGIVSTAFFLAGVISHHLSFLCFLEELPRLFASRRKNIQSEDERSSSERRRSSKGAESAEETNRRYEEYLRANRAEKPESEPEKEAQGSKRKKPQPEAQGRGDRRQGQSQQDAEAELRREKIRMQQEQERQERERERLKRERDQLDRERRASKDAPDTRTDEQILGLSGDYTLAELKQARNAEVKRWNTSNMRHKPAHLIAQAEEEAKKINLAYERLVKKFR